MAYVNPQVQIDQQQNERNSQNQAAIGQGIMQAVQSVNENRRRAVDAKKAQDAQNLQYAANGATPELIAQANAGDMTGMQKLFSDKYTTSHNAAADAAKLDADFKRSQITKNNRYGTGAGNDLEVYREKQRIKNEFKDTQNDEGVSKAAQTKIVQNNIGLANVKSAMDSALTVLQDPKVPEDQKVKTGQSLFKLLNSAEGADAVGAEEAKRIGSYLEYNIGNFTQPGAFIGRDLGGFTDQIKNYSTLLGDRVKRNEHTAEGLKQGKKISETIQSQDAQPAGSATAKPWEKYSK